MNTELMSEIEGLSRKPRVMLVDDQSSLLKHKANILRDFGCSVYVYLHTDEALRKYLNSPSFDMIVTDICFIDGSKDRSGMAFARLIRDIGEDVFMCGYSAAFEDEDISVDDKALFNKWIRKDRLLRTEELFYEFENLAMLAKEQKNKRIKESNRRLERLRRNFNISESQYALIDKYMISIHDEYGDDSEYSDSDYSLEMLRPGVDSLIKQIVLIWTYDAGEEYEVEVYGHPQLHATGKTKDEAIRELLDLIQLTTLSISGSTEKDFQGPALKTFLFINYAIGELGG